MLHDTSSSYLGEENVLMIRHSHLAIICDVEISRASDSPTDEEGRPSVVNNKMITSSRLARRDPTQGHRMSSVPASVLGNFLLDPCQVVTYILLDIVCSLWITHVVCVDVWTPIYKYVYPREVNMT